MLVTIPKWVVYGIVFSHITPHFSCRPCSVYIVSRSLQLWCNDRGEENQSSLTRSGSPYGWEVGWKTCWETAENVGKTWENPRKCWENTGRPKKNLVVDHDVSTSHGFDLAPAWMVTYWYTMGYTMSISWDMMISRIYPRIWFLGKL